MDVIHIVQRPVYFQRPFGSLKSPYTNHPGCSVLCQHSKASAHHKILINLSRSSWCNRKKSPHYLFQELTNNMKTKVEDVLWNKLEKVRLHTSKSLGRYQDDGLGNQLHLSGRKSPSGMNFAPIGIEGLKVNIPEEFLAKFARSDSRPDSPAPTLLIKRNCKLDCYRRCVTPDSLFPVPNAHCERLRRTKSEGDLPSALLTGLQLGTMLAGARIASKRKLGRSEVDFTAKLSKQLDLAAKNRVNAVNEKEPRRSRGEVASGPRGQRRSTQEGKPKSSDDQSLKSGDKSDGRRRGKPDKRKRSKPAHLDDPGETGISTMPESRIASGHSNASSGSSKPTSALSSKSGSGRMKNFLKDPLSFDPKQFLSEGHHTTDDAGDLRLIKESSQSRDADNFWLHLPRVPSRAAAIFSLPVHLAKLEEMTCLQYLQRYFHIRSSRQQLHKKIFLKHRDTDSIRVDRLPCERIPIAVKEAIGSEISTELLSKVQQFTEATGPFLDLGTFNILAALTERLYCQEISSFYGTEIEQRDLVEQLDFSSVGERTQQLQLNPQLKELLGTIENLD